MNGNKYIKSGFWYIIGNLLIKGISFFTLPIFTRLLGTADFGKFNLFMSYENILNVIVGLGIAGTIKTAYLDYKKEFKNYFSAVIFLILVFASIIGLVINILIVMGVNSGDDLWNIGTVNLLVICSLATAYYNLFSMKYVIDLKYKANLVMSFAYTLSSVGLSVGLCYFIFSDARYLARIIGNTIPLGLITFTLAITCLAKNKIFYHKKYWRYALEMGLPLILHSLSLVIMQQAGKIMVNLFCGDALTGIYSLACNISIILTIVQSSVDNSWSPWFYRNLQAQNYSVLISKNNYVIILFMYLTCGFILISPELIAITSPAEYQDAIFAVIPLNVSVYASFMYMFAVNKEYYFKKTPIIALATTIATILSVGLNYLLIPRYGFISASYATLAANIVLFIIHWYASNRIEKNKVVNLKFLLISFLGVVTVSFISVMFMNNIFIRFSIIVIITAIIYLFFKKKGLLNR